MLAYSKIFINDFYDRASASADTAQPYVIHQVKTLNMKLNMKQYKKIMP